MFYHHQIKVLYKVVYGNFFSEFDFFPSSTEILDKQTELGNNEIRNQYKLGVTILSTTTSKNCVNRIAFAGTSHDRYDASQNTFKRIHYDSYDNGGRYNVCSWSLKNTPYDDDYNPHSNFSRNVDYRRSHYEDEYTVHERSFNHSQHDGHHNHNRYDNQPRNFSDELHAMDCFSVFPSFRRYYSLFYWSTWTVLRSGYRNLKKLLHLLTRLKKMAKTFI